MFPLPRFVESNGIRMAVFERGEGPTVIMVHGFPELAYSWRHQIPALADAGFRAIAPDMRGYGQTDSPAGVECYAAAELIRDLQGLLDALHLERAVFVGHDWGALLLWQMAMQAPERIEKLIILNIPHIPRPPVDPIELMRRKFGDDFYIVNFQQSDEADIAFAAEPEHFFDVLMRKNQITRAETQSGFTNPINWYRNWTKNWQALEGVDQVIDIPTLFIGAADDVIIAPEQIEAMKPLVNDLTIEMLDPCGHWTQQERPEDVNRLIIDWLSSKRR